MSQDLPRFDMKRIYQRRDRLVARCIQSRIGQVIQSDELASLVTALRTYLPDGITRDAVYESTRYLAGKPLTLKAGFELCWRLAGNTDKLQDGPVPPWATQTEPEWVPLQIIKAVPFRNQRGAPGYNYDFRVLAGTPCPMRIQAFWGRDLARMAAIRMGFSKWHSGQYPYNGGPELVGLWLAGQIDPLRSVHVPTFYEIAVPTTFVGRNRIEVLKTRCRVTPCPRGFTHACRVCAVGYQNCPAATHRQDYVQRFCPLCGNEQVWFDPELTSERCINCHTKELMKAYH